MKTVAALPRVLGISLVVAGATYGCTFLIKRTYQSDELLYFPQAETSSNPLQALKDSATGNSDDGGTVSLINGMLNSPYVGAGPQTASGILTSHTAIRNCVDQLDLDHSWGMDKNDAYDQLDKWTDAKVDKNGNLDVTATAESPQQAVDILKNLENYLSERSQELTLNVSRSNRVYLEERVANAKQDVDNVQNKLADTMKNSPLADIDDLMKNYFTAREDLQQAEVAEAAGESKFKALQEDSQRLASGGDTFPNNIVTMGSLSSDVKTLTDEIQARQLALQDAMSSFTKGSPEYKQAENGAKSVQDVSKAVVTAGKTAVQKGLTPQLIQAQSDLSGLKSATVSNEKIIADFEKSALKAPSQYADVARMKLEFDQAMKAYGVLREQLEIAKLAESRDPSRFAVIDEPFANPKPIGPRRGLMSAVAFILAALVQLAFNSLKEEDEDHDSRPPLNGHRRREMPSEEAVVKAELPRKAAV